MACCEAPPKNQTVLCTQDARPGFRLSVYQEFRSQALTFSALSQANQPTSSYQAGVEAYMCQAGIADPAVFAAEQAEALAYFKRQFALPSDATLAPVDGVPQTTQDRQALGFLGLPLWAVQTVLIIEEQPVTVTIGYYRPTVTCRGLEVLCGSGLGQQYTRAALLLHELYFSSTALPGQAQEAPVQAQDVPVPVTFPPWQHRASPQEANDLQWCLGGTTRLELPLQVYGRLILYSGCGQHQAEIKLRSEFAVLPTQSVSSGQSPILNQDGVTVANENGNFGGSRLSAASRDLSNGQWIGFADWSFSATTTFNSLATPPITVQGPIDLHQAESLVVTFPPSLTRCAKITPCPCPRDH